MANVQLISGILSNLCNIRTAASKSDTIKLFLVLPGPEVCRMRVSVVQGQEVVLFFDGERQEHELDPAAFLPDDDPGAVGPVRVAVGKARRLYAAVPAFQRAATRVDEAWGREREFHLFFIVALFILRMREIKWWLTPAADKDRNREQTRQRNNKFGVWSRQMIQQLRRYENIRTPRSCVSVCLCATKRYFNYRCVSSSV